MIFTHFVGSEYKLELCVGHLFKSNQLDKQTNARVSLYFCFIFHSLALNLISWDLIDRRDGHEKSLFENLCGAIARFSGNC